MTGLVLRLPSWGDREIRRFNFRVELFKRRGENEHTAEQLADRLYERDYERDPRRSCLECRHLQRGGTCFAAQQGWLKGSAKQMRVLRYQFQNCPFFEFVTP